MNYAMEMHDSSLEELVCNSDGTGYALFHAVIHRGEGEIFPGPHESGWQGLRFDFEGMRIEGKVGELNTWASDGELWIDGKNENGIICLQPDHVGDLCLEVCLAQDFRILKIHATRIQSSLIGEFKLECLWDADGNTHSCGSNPIRQ
jgi:hypothetical protein